MDEAKRLELHAKLSSILPEGSKNNVYFQPPENLKMQYPCIVYSIDRFQSINADNTKYKIDTGFTVTYITKNPIDYNYLSIFGTFPMSTYNRRFINDGLYHNTFVIYF